ncbi:PAS domain-containing protein [Nisaea sediminum]|uniref:PAS domain-containing protein n=1 Tax=Nisaea sediminum TaxID=2775867 RepID=UPI001867D160|nr:PAS domain-containing protein [Nisaea sediminum]
MDEHPSLQRARDLRDRAQAAEVRELLSYWIAIHPGDRIPARAAFDPTRVPLLLPNLVLTDVERDPYRFRVRLMGTGIVEAMGGDFTGRYLDEVWEDAGNQLLVRDRVEVAETGLPNYRYGLSPTPFKLDFAALERAFLPFAANGKDVDMILSVIVYMRPGPEE